jgi:serine/threonine protein kinase
MAPEVVGRKGYTWCVDWWSFGITIYELLFLRRPFDGRTSEKMTNSILKDPLKFPDDVSKKCSPNCVKFVQAVSADTLFSILFLLCCSYSNVMSVNVWAVDQMVKVSMTLKTVHGCRA